MRIAHCMAIGLAASVSVVPASLAQDSGGPDQGKPAGTVRNTGITLDVPVGSVQVGAQSLGGEPIFVRRMTVREGMTIVEVSTTPFMPVSASNEGPPGAQAIVRPDQPASW